MLKIGREKLSKSEGLNFNDQLYQVASHAAVQIDMIRLGRPTDGWSIRHIATWLARVSARTLSCEPFPALMVHNVAKALYPDRDLKLIDDIFPFAREASDAFSQSIWFDPTPVGWTRGQVLDFCLMLSRFASVDIHYGSRRQSPGAWRGVSCRQ